ERSKKAELLSWVHDHVQNRCVRGYALLTLLWSDGHSKIPLTFALHSNKKTLMQDSSIANNAKGIHPRSHDVRIRKESLMDKNSASIHLIRRALRSGLTPSYILYDSWFGFPRFYLSLLKLFHVHSICRIKKMPKVYYEYKGTRWNLTKLYSIMKMEQEKNKQRNVKSKTEQNPSSNCKEEEIVGSLVVKTSFDTTQEKVAKIVFLRNRNKKQEWLAFLSTDASLPEEEIVQTYAKRWGIELFFHVIKDLLQAEDEFQLIHFTSMYAHLTITMTRYCLLSWLERCAKDDRSKGDLFYQMCEELQDVSIREALFLCFEYIMECMASCMAKKNFDIVTNRIVSMFTDRIPLWIADSKRVSICEV
ncbi:MAG: transposase, partial [Caldisericia bacterium]|nr:transposase [Caldisericia bacterium]